MLFQINLLLKELDLKIIKLKSIIKESFDDITDTIKNRSVVWKQENIPTVSIEKIKEGKNNYGSFN